MLEGEPREGEEIAPMHEQEGITRLLQEIKTAQAQQEGRKWELYKIWADGRVETPYGETILEDLPANFGWLQGTLTHKPLPLPSHIGQMVSPESRQSTQERFQGADYIAERGEPEGTLCLRYYLTPMPERESNEHTDNWEKRLAKQWHPLGTPDKIRHIILGFQPRPGKRESSQATPTLTREMQVWNLTQEILTAPNPQYEWSACVMATFFGQNSMRRLREWKRELRGASLNTVSDFKIMTKGLPLNRELIAATEHATTKTDEQIQAAQILVDRVISIAKDPKSVLDRADELKPENLSMKAFQDVIQGFGERFAQIKTSIKEEARRQAGVEPKENNLDYLSAVRLPEHRGFFTALQVVQLETGKKAASK